MLFGFVAKDGKNDYSVFMYIPTGIYHMGMEKFSRKKRKTSTLKEAKAMFDKHLTNIMKKQAEQASLDRQQTAGSARTGC